MPFLIFTEEWHPQKIIRFVLRKLVHQRKTSPPYTSSNADIFLWALIATDYSVHHAVCCALLVRSPPNSSGPSNISFSCRSISSSALSSSSRLNLSSRIASSGKDLGSFVFAVDFDFDIFGLNNCQATPHTIDIVFFSKDKIRNPLHLFYVQMSTRNIVPCWHAKKILRVDKEKAKYCYLTFSMIISFFSDNFSR